MNKGIVLRERIMNSKAIRCFPALVFLLAPVLGARSAKATQDGVTAQRRSRLPRSAIKSTITVMASPMIFPHLENSAVMKPCSMARFDVVKVFIFALKVKRPHSVRRRFPVMSFAISATMIVTDQSMKALRGAIPHV